MVRFLADAGLHDAIVTGCLRREPAIDFLSAHEARLEGVSDPNVLAFATKEDRILVTSDFMAGMSMVLPDGVVEDLPDGDAIYHTPQDNAPPLRRFP